MAQPQTINPYASLIGQQISAGLTAVINAIPLSPTADDLVAQVATYVSSIYYLTPNAQTTVEIKALAYNAINSYRNNLVLNGNALYNGTQAPFIQMLIGNCGNTAPDSFQDRNADIEDNIGTSELTVLEQNPLFLATTFGTNANRYWIQQVANPTSPWISHFSTNAGQNYMNISLWSTAAMNGALAAYGATPAGLIEPTINAVSNQMISALIGALTITAGTVLFKWIPRITKPFPNSNMESINLMKFSNGLPPIPNVQWNAVPLSFSGTSNNYKTWNGGTWGSPDNGSSPDIKANESL